jgi:hypothetical protein
MNVYFRAGTYYFDKAVEFTDLDSGTATKPIIYAAYPGEKVIFSGGVVLDNKSFTDVKDSDVLSRLPSEAKDKVKQCSLEALGDKINFTTQSDVSQMNILNLVINDKYGIPARWPNKDEDNVMMDRLEGTNGFVYSYERPANWKNAKDAYVAGWLQTGYFFHYTKIKSIDTDSSIISVDDKFKFNLSKETGSHYFVNLLEEIDMENEYYCDMDKKILYYYPQSSFSKDKLQIAALSDVIFKMKSCSNVIVKGITFEALRNPESAGGFNLAPGFGGAVDMYYDSHDNLLDSCTFRTTYGRAVCLDGKNNGVTSSKFYNSGGEGVGFGATHLQEAVKSNNYVVNCEFTNLNFFNKAYNPGVALQGIGNTVAHNKFYDLFQQAMLAYSAADTTVEFNDISKCMQQGHDMGAVYSQSRTDNTSIVNAYNTYRYNYFHDNAQNSTGAFISKYTYNLYLDQPSVAQMVYGNIFENTDTSGALFNNGGVFSEIKNNVFVNVNNAIYARYSLWSEKSELLKARTQEEKDAIINRDVNKNESWKSKQVNIFAGSWLEKYPLIAKAWGEGSPTLENTYENNITFNAESLFDGNGTPPEKNNFTVKETDFVNYKNKDYTIKSNSELLQKNKEFKNVPVNRIGKFDTNLNKKLSKAVALNVGTPFSIVNGNKKQIDEGNINVMPQIIEGRTLVPVRFIAESLGAQVGWDGETKTVTLTMGSKVIKMQVDNNVINIDGSEKTMDVPPQIIEGRTLLPLRALVEGVGKNVFWDDRGLIVVTDDKNLFDKELDAHLVTRAIQLIKY